MTGNAERGCGPDYTSLENAFKKHAMKMHETFELWAGTCAVGLGECRRICTWHGTDKHAHYFVVYECKSRPRARTAMARKESELRKKLSTQGLAAAI